MEQVLALIAGQQSEMKQGTAPWYVGEQLKDIVRTTPGAAELVAQDLTVKDMSIAECEKKIAAFAREHRVGNTGFCGPADAARKAEQKRMAEALRTATQKGKVEATANAAADLKAAQEKAEKAMAAADKLKKKMKAAKAATEEKIAAARRDATQAAEAAAAEKIAAARRNAAAEIQQQLDAAQKAIAELKLQADRDSLQCSIIFDEIQQSASKLLGITSGMAAAGKGDQAAKLRHALAGALRALANQASNPEDIQ